MPDSVQPRSVRLAALMLWGLFAAGALLAIAGLWETSYLAGNLAEIEQKATMPAEAMRAALLTRDSAQLASGLGALVAAGALIARLLLPRGWPWTRMAVLAVCAFVAFGHVLLLVQDSAVGVQPYTDISNDKGQESLVNSLIVAPGYFLMLYPAETAGIILPFLIGWQLMKESAAEFFQRRRKPTPDRVFDVSEILAKRQKEVS